MARFWTECVLYIIRLFLVLLDDVISMIGKCLHPCLMFPTAKECLVNKLFFFLLREEHRLKQKMSRDVQRTSWASKFSETFALLSLSSIPASCSLTCARHWCSPPQRPQQLKCCAPHVISCFAYVNGNVRTIYFSAFGHRNAGCQLQWGIP